MLVYFMSNVCPRLSDIKSLKTKDKIFEEVYTWGYSGINISEQPVLSIWKKWTSKLLTFEGENYWWVDGNIQPKACGPLWASLRNAKEGSGTLISRPGENRIFDINTYLFKTYITIFTLFKIVALVCTSRPTAVRTRSF